MAHFTKAALLAAAAFASQPCQAAAQTRTFDVPSQAARTGLMLLARQAGVQVILPFEAGAVPIRAVKGSHAVSDAVRIALAGSGLEIASDNGRTIVLRKAAAKPVARKIAYAPAPTRMAQEPVAPVTMPAEPASPADIVVTANKREQRLNDVGLTVQVLSGQALRERQVASLEDIANTVPGLTYANTASNTPVYTLRGVGFNEQSIGAIAAVTVYQDEAPLAFSVLAAHSAYDLERIEVLKGPQGTLFGQNSTGGAINYVTAKPTDRTAAGVQLSYGRFNEVNAEGYVSGPLSETLKARLAVRAERGDAWQVSRSRPNGPDGRNGKTRNLMGRLLLDYEPSDAVHIQANVNGWIDRSDPIAPQFTGLHLARGTTFPFVINYANTYPVIDNARAADWNVDTIYGRTEMAQGSLRADIKLSEDITLTSLTSGATYKTRKGLDIDGMPFSLGQYDPLKGHIRTFNQELRLGNGGASRVRWIVGGNVERSHTDQTISQNLGDAGGPYFLGTVLGYPIAHSTFSNAQRITNLAVFGNVEFDISSALTLKGGVRYTDSRNRGRTCHAEFTGNPRDTGSFIYDIQLGGRYGRYPTGTCFLINDLGRTINGVGAGAPGEYAGILHEDNVSWRAGIDWKPADGLLLYANAAKGYKAGSFATASSTTFSGVQPVVQESLMSYEAGFKASLLDRLLQLNGAAFYYDYRDKQVRGKVSAPPFGIIDAVVNIPKASIRGWELELSARPAPGLTLGAAVTYVDGKVDRYTGINGAGVTGDFAGTRLPYSPKWQLSFNPDYSFPLSDRTSVFMGGSVNYKSDTIVVIGGDVNPANSLPADIIQSRLKAYTVVDLRAGLTLEGGRMRLGIYGKNVFNEYYWTSVHNHSDVAARFQGKPATYGIQFSYTY